MRKQPVVILHVEFSLLYPVYKKTQQIGKICNLIYLELDEILQAEPAQNKLNYKEQQFI